MRLLCPRGPSPRPTDVRVTRRWSAVTSGFGPAREQRTPRQAETPACEGERSRPPAQDGNPSPPLPPGRGPLTWPGTRLSASSPCDQEEKENTDVLPPAWGSWHGDSSGLASKAQTDASKPLRSASDPRVQGAGDRNRQRLTCARRLWAQRSELAQAPFMIPGGHPRSP